MARPSRISPPMRLFWFSTDPRPRRGFLASIVAAYRIALWLRCYGGPIPQSPPAGSRMPTPP